MKKYIISVFVLIGFASCNDFLDVKPHSFTDAVYWQTADQAEQALAGAYSALQAEEALGGEEWCGMEAFSDNAYVQDNGYTNFISMSEFRANQNTEGDWSLLSYKAYYKCIKRGCDVLANVSGMTLDASQKNRILGEANFLVAFSYFELAKRYGGLPLYDPNDSQSALVRATETKTWEEIEKYLTNASTLLDWTHEQGRPGLAAVYGLFAKVSAYREKWQKASDYADKVIDSKKYDLVAKYSDLFRIDNEVNSETLWALGARFGEYPITPILYLPNNVWNGKHDETNGAGWRCVSATKNIYDAYQSGDLRKSATVAQKGVDIITYNGSTDTLKAPNNSSPVVCVKFMNPYAAAYTDWNAGLDVPVVRYADVLLIKAEAIMNLKGAGPTKRTTGVADAALYFNKVRNRAGLASIAAPTFNDLIYERRMELAFEGGDRHFDLVRWGLAEEVYNSLPAEGSYKPARTFVKAKHRLLPYPQNEIDASNGSITQNDGYNN